MSIKVKENGEGDKEDMTHCKIEFTYVSHCVSKNLTPRRMLKKTSFLIAQIIGWNNSFQNMYDML